MKFAAPRCFRKRRYIRDIYNTLILILLVLPIGGMDCTSTDVATNPTPASVSGPNTFREVTDDFGDLASITGWGGVAVFDYDRDGDIDILLLNGPETPNRLFQNNGNAEFTDVAAMAGIEMTSDQCVVAGIGDFNNDGWLDLLIGRQAFEAPDNAAVETVMLLNNGADENGSVRFSAATAAQTGLKSTAPAMAYAIGDLDNDGLLDIVIGRYDFAEAQLLLVPIYESQPNELWRCIGVNGDGFPQYEQITDAGIEGTPQRGWSPETEDQMFIPGTWALHLSDVDGDGLLDLFDCHDIPGGIDYFHNDGNFKFTRRQDDILNKYGGWMGMTSGDYDEDGDIDYFMTNVGCDFPTNFLPNTVGNAHNDPVNGAYFHKFFRNEAGELADVTRQIPVAGGTALRPINSNGGTNLQAFEFGFGTTFMDADNRGRLDLYWIGDLMSILGGDLTLHSSGVGRFLFNKGDGGFVDETATRGLFDIHRDRPLRFGQHEAGRALAACDLNGDGFQDVVMTNGQILGGRRPGMRVLLNPSIDNGHWLTLRLNGNSSNRFGIGARVTVTVGGRTLVREVLTTNSAFLGQHPQAHFGLGDATTVESISITWPSGKTTSLKDVPVDQILVVDE